MLYQTGRLHAAQSAYQELLGAQPGNREALHQLGVIAARLGQFARAEELLARVVAADPRNAVAWSDRGAVLRELQRGDTALDCYDRAIELAPAYAPAHNNRGNLLTQMARREEALSSYDRALAIDGGYADAHNNRGVLLMNMSRWEESVASFDLAIAANPGHADAYCNRGASLEHLDRPADALANYDRALALAPGFALAHSNRGNVLRQLQRVDEAVASCDRALALVPDHCAAHLNKAMALLLRGDLAPGWSEFEWRWRNPAGALAGQRRRFTQPQWLGRESLAGKTILLHAEQGLGDTLQFCRYAPLVAALGAVVLLEVQPALKGVLAGLSGVALLLAQGDPLPPFDLHCPLMSLPLAFATTPTTIPAGVPYIGPNPGRLQSWAHILGPRTKPRVGLVWSGGFRPDQPEAWSVNRRRNIPWSEFAALLSPGIEFYSLQKGQPAEAELAAFLARDGAFPGLINLARRLDDFADTAAAIEQLDLVISVDTSTAHLAGALGKPVWILNRFDTCWRWLLERTDSPWYPTARLYRQESAGDWQPVLRRVRRDLDEHFAG